MIRRVSYLLLTVVLLPNVAAAGDWPQILGPHRNGAAEGEQLLPWQDGGPKNLWTRKVGFGFGGVAVVKNRVVVFHRVDNIERIEALDVRTGQRVWKADFPATYRGGINSDTGPRCVPLIHKERIYVFGAAGDLHCVTLGKGAKQWSQQPYRDFDGDEGYFGAGSTPIIADEKLLVNVGGSAGIAAFALDTGKLVWKSTEEVASYSSPTLAKINDESHAIFVTRMNTVSVDPKNGKVRFRFPFGKRGPTVNAATPLVFNNQLFVSASYGVGAKLVNIGKKPLRTLWSGDEIMSSQYTTCVVRDGHLYGVHGREDVGASELRCVDVTNGKVKWTEPRFGVAHVILAGNKLLVQKVGGELILADASPKGFRSLASATVSRDIARAMPALSNGRLFVRTSGRDGNGEIKCFQVGKTAE